jgi:DNA helicase II / ATP-dependent DNA helicase PcrA
MFKLSEQKKDLLDSEGPMLVLGGPGSGKTTIALLKAKKIIEEGIKNEQRVLFLSFARATIARVEQQSVGLKIPKIIRKHLEINTYHGFTWNILKSHGYLLRSGNQIRLLPPPEAASRLAEFKGQNSRNKEKKRLFFVEGLLHFDLFAYMSADLLTKSKSLLDIITDRYPVIIVDEFQDTNSDEWRLISLLGQQSHVIALADAEQRIYEFRGADPARIGEFITSHKPKQFDFGNENNRSSDTDIVKFGNDLITGANKGKTYNDVSVVQYPFRKGIGIYLNVKYALMSSVDRLKGTGKWSVAILTPSKQLMLNVSDFIGVGHKFKDGRVLPAYRHEVALETAGPSLAAVLIAGLLELSDEANEPVECFLRNLCEHIKGRKGDAPPNNADLTFSNAIANYITSGQIRGKNRKRTVDECNRIIKECRSIGFQGDPITDWLAIRNTIYTSTCNYIKQAALDSRYLRLLHKRANLNSTLGELWRTNGSYKGAINAVKAALLQEYFSMSTKVWTGIHVMTMHKAKGKEFDEVIIYEGRYQGKILRDGCDKKEHDQARLKLRVAATRAMKKVTILTPEGDVCGLL